jgi:hypothetical protein
VLIDQMSDHEGVFGLIIISLLLLVGPLAVVYGADSRIDDVARRRSFDR